MNKYTQGQTLVEAWKYFLQRWHFTGGLRGFIRVTQRIGLPDSDWKLGTLVGSDKFGNKYYENNRLMFGKHRWIDYGREKYTDPSMIPSEWHGWLHSMTDIPPTQRPAVKQLKLEPYAEESMTGTPWQYVPYSTTRPKVQSWQPPRARH